MYDWMEGNNKAIKIIRRSSRGQKDNTSAKTQNDGIDTYCDRLKLDVIRSFDIIETASKREKRKQFKEIDKWATKNKIRHRVYFKSDRETRNLTDNELAEDAIKANQYVLHYAHENKVFHKDTPDGDFLMRDYQAVGNKHYSRDLRTKSAMSLMAKADSGWFPGRVPPWGYYHKRLKNDHGYERARGTIIAIDYKGWKIQVVQREFELRGTPNNLYPDGIMPIVAVRKQIIKEGLVPTQNIKSHNKSSIDKRLKNVFFDDRFRWKGEEYKGKHERIISKELFWKVQETFGLKSAYKKRSAGAFGGGWLKCADPDCGCYISYDPKTKKIKSTGKEKTYRYYYCTNGKKVHKKRQTVNEDAIWRQFEIIFDQFEVPKELAKKIAQALNQGIGKKKDEFKKNVESEE
jgi:site-specific DNA recombinase